MLTVQAAQDCLEVLDQSLHNFLRSDNHGEVPRTPEGRHQMDEGEQSSTMEAGMPQQYMNMETDTYDEEAPR
jgi:hypothetical protein